MRNLQVNYCPHYQTKLGCWGSHSVYVLTIVVKILGYHSSPIVGFQTGSMSCHTSELTVVIHRSQLREVKKFRMNIQESHLDHWLS